MRVREAGRGDQQGTGLRHDLAPLLQELGFPVGKGIVEIDRPEQDAMQGLAARVANLRVQLAMPIGIAALVGNVFLDIDGAGAEHLDQQLLQLLIRELANRLRVEGHQFAADRVGHLQPQWGDRGLRILAHVGHEAAQHRAVEQVRRGRPLLMIADADVPAVLEPDVDAAAGLAAQLLVAGFELANHGLAIARGERVFVDLDEILCHATAQPLSMHPTMPAARAVGKSPTKRRR